ncbi:cytochrome c oxidase subunit 3 [Rubritalea marina]|uniref:cytochrome c oxidase subunit 3 n=1 Tax=Rubritalea marina TaxID=361055 RepID=UPI0003805B3B|nr:cytochrome c oxidase subunit 3 [Rubritalea marina]
MEIPYIVNARKDTGLNNSKIAIWLFLASEVMLFGGLFSSYIFLRIYADYPWPERTLPVLPGLINTFILILSSVTVVFAWAGLKLRNWNMFVANMAITIICAAVFMVFKAKEYAGKFHHHATQTEDYGWVEGHLHYDEGDSTHGNAYVVAAKEVNFSVDSTTANYLASIIAQAGDKLSLKRDYVIREISGNTFNEKVLFEAGTALTPEVIAEAKQHFIKARTHNQELRTQLLKDAWVIARDPNKHNELVGLKDFDSKVKNTVAEVHTALVKKAENNNEFLLANGNMVFDADGAELKFNSGWGRTSDAKEGDSTNLSLLDGTVVTGTAGDSNFHYRYVDALDFRHLVMKAEAKGLHADDLIEQSPILALEGEGGDKIRKIWKTHKEWRKHLAKHLEGRKDALTGEGRKPTEIDLYRVTWHQMYAYAQLDYNITEENWMQVKDDHQPSMIYDITGMTKEHKATFPKEVEVPREKVRFDSVFSPKMNNYYAIYFTITGLHGLHVIGGAIVLGYYLFFGRKMYNSNPEWLANRVEVGGLFWHFVDLVWILVFPVFYLM